MPARPHGQPHLITPALLCQPLAIYPLTSHSPCAILSTGKLVGISFKQHMGGQLMIWEFLAKYGLMIWFVLHWVSNMVAYVKESNEGKVRLALFFRASAQRYLILIMLSYIIYRLAMQWRLYE